ncbi:MAG: hypothetical protein LC734_05035 [Acidobacteria bacterium]|nr:hypothetical protein [Acidobacteriota bacterium]
MTENRVGTLVAEKYRIAEPVGGELYRAHHELMDKPVLIKFPQNSSPIFGL